MDDDTAKGQYPAQVGIWTLTAPDGRTWQAPSPLRAVAAEQHERIPARVALARVMDAAHDAGLWRDEDETPKEGGWFAIKREDGSLCLRAWGAGVWWIPLKDGWLSGLPPGFQWIGPVADINWMPPKEKEA